jgi:membrane-bound lytic murein transglycosylase B
MVIAMEPNRNTLRKLLYAAAFTAALAGTAAAQMPMPSFSLEHEKNKTPEQIAHDKAVDQAYQSATKKIPDKSVVNDPWADVRPTPAAVPEKKKQQMSQNKKHAQ